MARTNLSVPFSCPPELLKLIDKRAEALGLNRSAYIQHLVRNDLNTGGDFSIINQPANPHGVVMSDRSEEPNIAVTDLDEKPKKVAKVKGKS